MMGLKQFIDIINGQRVQLAPGISVDINQGINLQPVIVRSHVGGSGVAIYFPHWPQLTIGFTPEAVKFWSILASIAGYEPANLNGYLIDFHGQLPKITAQPNRDSVKLTWTVRPKIDLRWVPSGLDPTIHFADLFSDRIELVGSFGMKVIKFGGEE